MKIAMICPLWIPIPPLSYGGTELVIYNLTEELVKRGHEVTLFASGDSQTSAKLASIWPKSLWRDKTVRNPHAVINLMMNELLERQDEFDLIHNHFEFYVLPFANYLKKPLVTTLHRPLSEETLLLLKKFPQSVYVAISENQKKEAKGLKISEVIYNGINIEDYPFSQEPGSYLLWLSKLVPEKGAKEAIQIAHRSGEKLFLAGNIVDEKGSYEYFQKEINPFVDGEQVRYLGAVAFQEKIELLKNAKALIYPILRKEPFGLVVTEAMACGAPVIALRNGAMPELIEEGKSGYLANDLNGMVKAVKKIKKIKRQDCRERVEKLFTTKKMTDQYEKLYSRILATKDHLF